MSIAPKIAIAAPAVFPSIFIASKISPPKPAVCCPLRGDRPFFFRNYTQRSPL
ncbi:MAG: hypothetical protein GDA48_23305 [Hormoscilla sp. GM102CHS1]|nr:hypothetical protein [Hormoscilla sp. GM102CHS1]